MAADLKVLTGQENRHVTKIFVVYMSCNKYVKVVLM